MGTIGLNNVIFTFTGVCFTHWTSVVVFDVGSCRISALRSHCPLTSYNCLTALNLRLVGAWSVTGLIYALQPACNSPMSSAAWLPHGVNKQPKETFKEWLSVRFHAFILRQTFIDWRQREAPPAWTTNILQSLVDSSRKTSSYCKLTVWISRVFVLLKSFQARGSHRIWKKQCEVKLHCRPMVFPNIAKFVEKITKQADTKVGHGLTSHTSNVSAIRIRNHLTYQDRLVLIDTPGFNDTSRCDIDILDDISKWLAEMQVPTIIHINQILTIRQVQGEGPFTRCSICA